MSNEFADAKNFTTFYSTGWAYNFYTRVDLMQIPVQCTVNSNYLYRHTSTTFTEPVFVITTVAFTLTHTNMAV